MSHAKMFSVALSFLIMVGLNSVLCQLCNRPSNDQIENGIIKPKCSTRGCSFLTIECDRCFKQVGPERIGCVKGKWAAINSRCIPTSCEPLKLTAGIAASSNSTHCGAVVKLKCVKGYEPTKAIKMACKPTGKWEGTRLKCTKSKKKCPDLILPKNARVVKGRLAGNRAGDFTVLECEERYEQIAGSRVVECLKGGRWNGSLIECKEPVNCVWGPWSNDTKCTSCDDCCIKYCLRYRKQKPAHDEGRDCVGQSTDYVIRKCDKKECAKTWEKPKRCWGWGDVHYHSLDDLEYNFQGVCKYTLVEDTIGFFKVFVKNRQWGNTALSVTQYVEIHLAGDIIRLDGPGSIQVKVNEIPLPPGSLPYNTQWYTANVVGNTMTFESTPLTLRIEFNIHPGYGDVYITLGRQWMRMVDGLCKNYDDNTPNDCTDKAGTNLTGNPNKGELLGISYKVPDPQDPNCVDMLRTSGPTCSAQTKAAANKFCRFFENDIAIFLRMTIAEIKTWVDNCIMDYCAAPDAKCDIMEAFFVAIRRSEGQDIMEQWRKIFKCPRQCGLNEVYLYDGPGCEPHCVESELRWCAEHRREGCFCKPGYIRCKGKCIIPTGCHWSTWGSWQYGSCSKTCGTGRKDRIRTRTKQPVGSGCQGVSVETGYVDCSNAPCCHWSAWGSWQYGSCSKTCDTGRKPRSRTRRRLPGGSGCLGVSVETGYVNCDNPPCCHWSPWGSWRYGSCSKTCGTGRKDRSRTRTKLPGGSGCPGLSIEKGYVDCRNTNSFACGCHWSAWGSWQYQLCSKTCGTGGRKNRRRRRTKQPGGSGCPGNPYEIGYVNCYNPDCGCTHKGRFYAEGSSFRDDCNTCWCYAGGKVTCTLIGCWSILDCRIALCIPRFCLYGEYTKPGACCPSCKSSPLHILPRQFTIDPIIVRPPIDPIIVDRERLGK